MISVQLSELQAPLNAQLHGDNVSISCVSTDTRKAQPQGLFVALKGERFDAHDFVAQAKAQGAIALVVERLLDIDLPQLLVRDCRLALGQLGAFVISRLALPCCGITGSNGKTTVKEMTRAILAEKLNVLCTQGNLNNDIGVPLTLLDATAEHDCGVIEMGANHIGEIAYTSNLVKPQVALINNVGSAHIEGFGSAQGVLKAKSELFMGLGEKQLAICEYNADYKATLIEAARPAKMQFFDLNDSRADYYASDIQLDALQGAAFTLHTPQGAVALRLNLLGEHNVKNAVGASALALAMGASLEHVVRGLSNMSAVGGRLTRISLTEHVSVIDDSYNANPASFKAALNVLQHFDGQRVLVAGAMAEMGDESLSAHAQLVSDSLQANVALYCYGAAFDEALVQHGQGSALFDSHEALAAQLGDELLKANGPCLVLVKGSRSSRMEQVIDLLQQRFNEGGSC